MCLCSKSVILVEQLQAAEARCRRLEAAAAQQAHLLAEQEPQQRELQQWRSLVGDLPDEQRNPQALNRMLDELRAQALALSEQASQHKAESLRLQGGPQIETVGASQRVHASAHGVEARSHYSQWYTGLESPHGQLACGPSPIRYSQITYISLSRRNKD